VPKPFVFTPVPYITVQPPVGELTLVVLDEQGRPAYTADELLVSIERDQKDEFLAWLATSSFELKQLLNEDEPTLDFLLAILRVPPGSVLDARELILREVDVRSVDLNHILTAD
jgi:hypothetical protein